MQNALVTGIFSPNPFKRGLSGLGLIIFGLIAVIVGAFVFTSALGILFRT